MNSEKEKQALVQEIVELRRTITTEFVRFPFFSATKSTFEAPKLNPMGV